jgi:Uma2 family endonuclease
VKREKRKVNRLIFHYSFFTNFVGMGIEGEIKRYTLAEYLELEEQAEFWSEFYNGEIFAMAGGTPEHGTIASNCGRAIGDAFEAKGCRTIDASLMVYVEKINAVLHPDLSVICGPLERHPNGKNLVRNPGLIVEVLSDGTEKYDGGNKFFKYKMIPSLQAYILVQQHEPMVHVSYKNENGSWDFDDYFGLEAVIDLKPYGVSITMAQIYKWIEFQVKSEK